MLGEKIAEYTSKTTSRRVLNGTNGLKMEVSMEQTGKFFGADVIDFGTYESVMTEVGTLDGTGVGITMTKDGEMVQWKATGVGKFTGKGMGLNWRGSISYTTKSQKLARANGSCFVFEYDIDETGNNAVGRVFEWK